MNTKFRKRAELLAAVSIAAGFAADGWAGSSTHDLNVTASVPQKCLISTSAMAFGPYDPVSTNGATGSDLNGAAQANVTCTKSSTGTSITLGLGNNASGTTRRMVGAGSGGYLTYEIYHPSAATPGASCTFPGTTVWGTSGGGVFTPSGVADWGGGAAKQFNICATIPKGQDVPADAYHDSVITTINF